MHILKALSLLSAALLATACGGGDGDVGPLPHPQPYRLTGTIAQDSIRYDASLTLLVDHHDRLEEVTVPVARGRFAFESQSLDVDELCLSDTLGRRFAVYAMGGQEVEIEIDSLGRMLLLGQDSVNTWLADAVAAVDSLPEAQRQAAVDSLCVANRQHIRAGLLLRHYLPQCADSVAVRRTLGSLEASALPLWLSADIEQTLDRQGRRMREGRTASVCTITTLDTLIDLAKNHPEGYLIVFWSDFDGASVDTLARLDAIARQYGLHQYAGQPLPKGRPKRMELLTVCLGAADSAAWRKRVSGVPGRHALMPAGWADPRVRRWGVTDVPQAMLINQYGNIMSTQWGAALRRAIDRMPERPATPAANRKTAPPPAGRKSK